MKIVLDPKQLEMIQQMLDRIAKVAQEIATEMKRANDLKEKELSRQSGIPPEAGKDKEA